MFCEMQNVSFQDFIKGRLPDTYKEKDLKFIEEINKIDFEIVEYGYTFREVEGIIEGMYKDKKPDVIFIDFIQLIEWKSFNEERLALMEYIRKLKELAKREDVGVVIISQLRRLPSGANYERPPDIIDLKGSGSLEQTADKVILIHREISQEQTKYFINLAKNRQGMTGQEEVEFKGEFYKFLNIGGFDDTD